MHAVAFPNSGLVRVQKNQQQQHHIAANQSSFHCNGNRKGRVRRNTPSDKNGKEIDKTKSSSQEEIIAVFRRIQLSISKGGSLVSKRRTPSKPKDEQSAESILGALRRHPARKQAKDKTSVQGENAVSIKLEDKDGDKLETNAALPGYGDDPEIKAKESTSAPEIPKVSRPASNFVKRSPIPQPSSKNNTEQASDEQLTPVTAKAALELQKIDEMKLPELLTLTGPDEHRLNPMTLGSICSALARVRADSGGQAAALVTAAEGKFFSNGLDLAWARVSPADRTPQLGSALRGMIADLISLPMPTIAAITGHAAAGGFILARAHDYVVMRGDRGFVYMSELDIGVPISKYAMSVLRSRISDARALRDLLLRPEKMGAGEAERKGVIDRAVEGGAEEAVAAAVRMGEEMAARGWDGGIYASIRKGAFPEVFRDLGLEEDTDEDIRRVFTSKL